MPERKSRKTLHPHTTNCYTARAMAMDMMNSDTVYKLGGFKVDREIVRYIREASDSSGISFDYLLAKAGHESRFETNAAALRSSAEGLFQFTTDTWLQQMKLHGAKYGYAKLAAKIYRDGRGRYRVKNAADKDEILALRRSPRISALLAAEFAKSNKKILEDQIGVAVTSADLYLAHFMGPSGAVMLLRADKFTPHKFAADLFPEAALANPPIFYNEKGRMLTVRQVRRRIADIFQDKIDRFAVLPKSLKVWLDDLPKDRKSQKPAVVVDAPILRMEAALETNAPMPKIIDSNRLANILPGEGVNLDDDGVLNEMRVKVLSLAARSGTDDSVSADFVPVRKMVYDAAGTTAMETDGEKPAGKAYDFAAATWFETDEYPVSAPLPVAVTAMAADVRQKEL